MARLHILGQHLIPSAPVEFPKEKRGGSQLQLLLDQQHQARRVFHLPRLPLLQPSGPVSVPLQIWISADDTSGSERRGLIISQCRIDTAHPLPDRNLRPWKPNGVAIHRYYGCWVVAGYNWFLLCGSPFPLLALVSLRLNLRSSEFDVYQICTPGIDELFEEEHGGFQHCLCSFGYFWRNLKLWQNDCAVPRSEYPDFILITFIIKH